MDHNFGAFYSSPLVFDHENRERKGMSTSLDVAYLIVNGRVGDRIKSLYFSGNMNINACHPSVYDHQDGSGEDDVDRDRQTCSNGDNELENAREEVPEIAG